MTFRFRTLGGVQSGLNASDLPVPGRDCLVPALKDVPFAGCLVSIFNVCPSSVQLLLACCQLPVLHWEEGFCCRNALLCVKIILCGLTPLVHREAAV